MESDKQKLPVLLRRWHEIFLLNFQVYSALFLAMALQNAVLSSIESLAFTVIVSLYSYLELNFKGRFNTSVILKIPNLRNKNFFFLAALPNKDLFSKNGFDICGIWTMKRILPAMLFDFKINKLYMP
jgi:hypothetical protein